MVDAAHAFTHAVAIGAEPFTGSKALEVPAIVGIGGSLIYFVDQYGGSDPYTDFTFTDHNRRAWAFTISIT